jgi:hypothetical protein
MDMGLVLPTWDKLGAAWQDLTVAWLAAELVLAKSGKTPLTATTLEDSGLPDALQQWARSILEKSPVPLKLATKDHAAEMQDWVAEIGDEITDRDRALKELWCAPGKFGLNLVLLGMKFWIDFAGPTTGWMNAQKTVIRLFSCISQAPSL